MNLEVTETSLKEEFLSYLRKLLLIQLSPSLGETRALWLAACFRVAGGG